MIAHWMPKFARWLSVCESCGWTETSKNEPVAATCGRCA